MGNAWREHGGQGVVGILDIAGGIGDGRKRKRSGGEEGQVRSRRDSGKGDELARKMVLAGLLRYRGTAILPQALIRSCL